MNIVPSPNFPPIYPFLIFPDEIEASSIAGRHRGDYYGALVGVGAVAALGALTSLLLLLVVLRRHRPRSVPITSE